MDGVGSDCPQGSEIEREAIAPKEAARVDPSRAEDQEGAPSAAQMRIEEEKESGETDQAVFAEQVKVVVVHVERIVLHACTAELASIKAIGAAPGPNERLQFPLLKGGAPKIKAGIIGHRNLFHSRADLRVLRDQRSGRDQRDDQRDQRAGAKPEEGSSPGWPQGDEAEEKKEEEAGPRAQISSAAASHGEAHIADRREITKNHPGRLRPATPAGNGETEHPENLEQPGEVIRVGVEAAGPVHPGYVFQVRKGLEILGHAELNEPDKNVEDGDGQQRHDERKTAVRAGHGRDRQAINDERRQDRIEIGPGEVGRWRGERPGREIAAEESGRRETKTIGRGTGLEKKGNQCRDPDQAIRRETKPEFLAPDEHLQEGESNGQEQKAKKIPETGNPRTRHRIRFRIRSSARSATTKPATGVNLLAGRAGAHRVAVADVPLIIRTAAHHRNCEGLLMAEGAIGCQRARRRGEPDGNSEADADEEAGQRQHNTATINKIVEFFHSAE